MFNILKAEVQIAFRLHLTLTKTTLIKETMFISENVKKEIPGIAAMESSQSETKAELLHILALSLLDTSQNDSKSTYHSNTCTKMFIMVLVIVARKWNQPR